MDTPVDFPGLYVCSDELNIAQVVSVEVSEVSATISALATFGGTPLSEPLSVQNSVLHDEWMTTVH